MSDHPSPTKSLSNQVVVLDMASPFVVIGTLTGEDIHYYILDDVDVHDLRDTSTTRELYVVETRRHGVRSNRKRALIRKSNVVGLSRLSDVLL